MAEAIRIRLSRGSLLGRLLLLLTLSFALTMQPAAAVQTSRPSG